MYGIFTTAGGPTGTSSAVVGHFTSAKEKDLVLW